MSRAPAPSLVDAPSVASALGVSFRSPALLVEALTHSSTGAAVDNQRLEFLGDRVLGLAVADLLMAARPDEDEGALARRFAVLVSAATLADVAREIGLGDHLVVNAAEARAGGRTNRANLADACEALIAALYLDGGLEAAAAFVARHWADRIAAQKTPPVDAKSALQEWTLARGLGVPAYRTVSVDGPDHRPTFRVSVEVPGHGTAESDGSGKRRAETGAAARMLERIARVDGDIR